MKAVTMLKAMAVLATLTVAGQAGASNTFADKAADKFGNAAYGIAHHGTENFQVCPPPGVPEPGTWAMMGIGLAVLGAVARRRKAQ